MSEVADFKPGLEGVVAVETEIAEPDREGGVLRYRGVDIAELVGRYPYERVWGLLVDDDLDSVMPEPEPYEPAGLTGNAPADLQAETARLAGHCVLGLAEHDLALRGEHLGGDVAVATLAERARGDVVETGHQAGAAVAEPVAPPEHPVREEVVVEPRLPPGQGFRLVEGAVVALGQAAFGVREPVELEVLVGLGQLIEALEHLDAQRHLRWIVPPRVGETWGRLLLMIWTAVVASVVAAGLGAASLTRLL